MKADSAIKYSHGIMEEFCLLQTAQGVDPYPKQELCIIQSKNSDVVENVLRNAGLNEMCMVKTYILHAPSLKDVFKRI